MYAQVENGLFHGYFRWEKLFLFLYFWHYFEVTTLIKQRVKLFGLDEQKLITCVHIFQLDKYNSQNTQLNIVCVPCYSLTVLCFKQILLPVIYSL